LLRRDVSRALLGASAVTALGRRIRGRAPDQFALLPATHAQLPKSLLEYPRRILAYVARPIVRRYRCPTRAGVGDSTAAIQNACQCGARDVYLPPRGHIRISPPHLMNGVSGTAHLRCRPLGIHPQAGLAPLPRWSIPRPLSIVLMDNFWDLRRQHDPGNGISQGRRYDRGCQPVPGSGPSTVGGRALLIFRRKFNIQLVELPGQAPTTTTCLSWQGGQLDVVERLLRTSGSRRQSYGTVFTGGATSTRARAIDNAGRPGDWGLFGAAV